MKAILIDPFVMTTNVEGGLELTGEPPVREIDIEDSAGLSAIYEALTHELHHVRTFDVVHVGDAGDAIFIDDEALHYPHDHWFLWRGCPQPLAGRGLILGMGDDGASVSPKTSLEAASAMVRVGFHNIEIREDGTVAALPLVFPRFYQNGWDA